MAIRTAATPEFIEAASRRFGAQAIVFALDIKLPSSLHALKRVCRTVEDAGAGEILLTSVDRNGTMSGYDPNLIFAAANAVSIPVIAHGGCGEPKHMLTAIQDGAHAVAASTMFLFTETTPRDCSRYLAEHGIAARVA